MPSNCRRRRKCPPNLVEECLVREKSIEAPTQKEAGFAYTVCSRDIVYPQSRSMAAFGTVRRHNWNTARMLSPASSLRRTMRRGTVEPSTWCSSSRPLAPTSLERCPRRTRCTTFVLPRLGICRLGSRHSCLRRYPRWPFPLRSPCTLGRAPAPAKSAPLRTSGRWLLRWFRTSALPHIRCRQLRLPPMLAHTGPRCSQCRLCSSPQRRNT